MTAAFAAHVGGAELLMFACHWLTLWLAFSLLGVRPWSAPYALFGLASLAVSTYFLSNALLLSPQPAPDARAWITWLGGWVSFAPVFALQTCLRLTGVRVPWQRVLLAVTYGLAALVVVAILAGDLIYGFVPAGPGASANLAVDYVAGPLYPLFLAQVSGTLVITLVVLVRARREAGARTTPTARAIKLLMVGFSILLVTAVLLFLRALMGAGLSGETPFVPFLAVGVLLVAVPLVGYPGTLGGQLLTKDLLASLLSAAALLSVFTAATLLSEGGSAALLAGVGWLVLAGFVFRDHLLRLTDRVFFAASERAGRAGLRLAATYAGSRRPVDVTSLTAQQYGEVVDYGSGLDRAELAAARLQESRDPRLDLLALEEYRPVRVALGLDASWSPDQGVPHDGDPPRQKAIRLEPRERQVLGLRHLGYSDKEMAALLGVKPNVPTSYLSQAKQKLGLPAGPSLALFVHFSGFVEHDALPLLQGRGGPRPSIS